jgi:hypothetical protein
MPEIERFGTGGTFDRELLLLELTELAQLPDRLPIESPHFVCLILCDATGITTAEIARFSESLLSQGAVYLLCWGPDCERIHDIIDETMVGGVEPIPRFSSSIITTWHARESLDDALNMFLGFSWPDDEFLATCRSSLAVSVGQPLWCSRVREALGDVPAFFRGLEDGAA